MRDKEGRLRDISVVSTIPQRTPSEQQALDDSDSFMPSSAELARCVCWKLNGRARTGAFVCVW